MSTTADQQQAERIAAATDAAVVAVEALMREHLASCEPEKYARISQLCGQAQGLRKMVGGMMSDFDPPNANLAVRNEGAPPFAIRAIGPPDQFREILMATQPLVDVYVEQMRQAAHDARARELSNLTSSREIYASGAPDTAEKAAHLALIDKRIAAVVATLEADGRTTTSPIGNIGPFLGGRNALVPTDVLRGHPAGVASAVEVPRPHGEALPDGEGGDAPGVDGGGPAGLAR